MRVFIQAQIWVAGIFLYGSWIAGKGNYPMKDFDANALSEKEVNVRTSYENPGNAANIIVGEGEYQVFFIDGDKHLWGLGRIPTIGVNNAGKVGIPQRVQAYPDTLRFKTVAGSLHGGIAVDQFGYIWTIGANDHGQLGVGNDERSFVPMLLQVDSAGRPFQDFQSVVAFYCMNKHNGFFALKTDGSLWVWGRPLGGMRGNGTDKTHADSFALRPVRVPMPGNRKVKQIIAGYLAIALCTDGTVWTWGPVPPVNLGYPAKPGDNLVPHQLTSLPPISQIAGGAGFNYALAENHSLYGWGQYGSYMGNSSIGDVAIHVPTLLKNVMDHLPFPIQRIVTNSVCTHVILTDGSLWGWGDNSQGNIGIGEEIDYTKTKMPFAWSFATGQMLVQYPRQVAPMIKFRQVWGSSVYTFYTYAEDDHGQLYCWGRNKTSVLANGIVSPGSEIDASYANAWDVVWPQKVDPFAVAATGTTWVSTCPACITNPSAKACNTYHGPPNNPPKANAGDSITISSTTTVLDGSKSSDDVHISYYEWKQLDGPSSALIDLPGNALAKAYGLKPGRYKFQLTTTDNAWLKDSAIVNILVAGPNNKKSKK